MVPPDALPMASRPAHPIGASAGVQNVRGTKRRHSGTMHETGEGQTHGPRLPTRSWDWAQRRCSPQALVDGRTVKVCTSWPPGRNIHSQLSSSRARLAGQQSQNPSWAEGGGGGDGNLGSTQHLQSWTAASSLAVGGRCCSICRAGAPLSEQSSGRTMCPKVTPQDVRELRTAMQNIGKAMTEVGDRMEMLMGACQTQQRSASTWIGSSA